MRIVDLKKLAEYRKCGPCEICMRLCQTREGHHLLSRGSGGSDIDINLIALGSTQQWECSCHTQIHNGLITIEHVRNIVAKREKTTGDVIREANFALAALDKELSDASLAKHVSWRPPQVRQLVYRVLAERPI